MLDSIADYLRSVTKLWDRHGADVPAALGLPSPVTGAVLRGSILRIHGIHFAGRVRSPGSLLFDPAFDSYNPAGRDDLVRHLGEQLVDAGYIKDWALDPSGGEAAWLIDELSFVEICVYSHMHHWSGSAPLVQLNRVLERFVRLKVSLSRAGLCPTGAERPTAGVMTSHLDDGGPATLDQSGADFDPLRISQTFPGEVHFY